MHPLPSDGKGGDEIILFMYKGEESNAKSPDESVGRNEFLQETHVIFGEQT